MPFSNMYDQATEADARQQLDIFLFPTDDSVDQETRDAAWAEFEYCLEKNLSPVQALISAGNSVFEGRETDEEVYKKLDSLWSPKEYPGTNQWTKEAYQEYRNLGWCPYIAAQLLWFYLSMPEIQKILFDLMHKDVDPQYAIIAALRELLGGGEDGEEGDENCDECPPEVRANCPTWLKKMGYSD